ncbi:MAG: sodium:solute symporter family protein [Clostridiales bacterium]|nr:sodium:solute symporter family protein [Clostridiales bacterium]
MGLSALHYWGAIFTIALIVGIGIYSGKRIKNAADFATGGRRAGSYLVMGMITGTLVGGASTIGTAQLAFTSGLSAWWFTLGGGIACLTLGLGFAKPLRATGCDTIQQMIGKEYGVTAGLVTAILGTLGMLINIISQLLSFNALAISMLPIDPVVCALIGMGFMLCYVVFGGVLGAGILGIIKLGLLYLSVIACGILALKLSGGFSALYNALPHEQYFNLFARGFGVDSGAGLSLLLGVLSTQTYIQAILSGKSDTAARKGALTSALLIPPIGAGGILIGQYMHLTQPALNPGLAFPQFIIDQLPPLLGGVVLATLLIAVIGTGAGLALGFATTLTNNIYLKFFNKQKSGPKTLLVMRLLIVFALAVAVIFTLGNLKSVILSWGFLSMALRGAVLFVPMCAALFLRQRVRKQYVIASSILGLCAVLVGKFTITGDFDPLFIGVGVSVLTVLIGVLVKSFGLRSGK